MNCITPTATRNSINTSISLVRCGVVFRYLSQSELRISTGFEDVERDEDDELVEEPATDGAAAAGVVCAATDGFSAAAGGTVVDGAAAVGSGVVGRFADFFAIVMSWKTCLRQEPFCWCSRAGTMDWQDDGNREL
jgi:hypothetical protein